MTFKKYNLNLASWGGEANNLFVMLYATIPTLYQFAIQKPDFVAFCNCITPTTIFLLLSRITCRLLNTLKKMNTQGNRKSMHVCTVLEYCNYIFEATYCSLDGFSMSNFLLLCKIWREHCQLVVLEFSCEAQLQYSRDTIVLKCLFFISSPTYLRIITQRSETG